MSANRCLEVELARDGEAPRRGRDLLRERFGDGLPEEELETARLLVSELVTNAVQHGKGTVRLRAELNENRLRVEVMDEGSGFERAIRAGDFDGLGGWGLGIVDAAASRWGVHEGTTHVWFDLELPGPRLGVDEKPAR